MVCLKIQDLVNVCLGLRLSASRTEAGRQDEPYSRVERVPLNGGFELLDGVRSLARC